MIHNNREAWCGNAAPRTLARGDEARRIGRWLRAAYGPKAVRVVRVGEQTARTFVGYRLKEVY